jgi:regulator of ribonuclease activity A
VSHATADLCDRHEEALRGGDLRIMAPMFRHFGGNTTFSGPIATLKLFEDNSFIRRTLEQPGQGRVLVVDGGGSLRRALVGDQLALLGVANGWHGLLVYGCIRDSAAIAAMDIGLMALATHPQKTEKRNTGQSDVPVSFGGVTIRPGEWLYADSDGILIAASELGE